eukprot:8597154-Alexandrium_andersonii.AAC.1
MEMLRHLESLEEPKPPVCVEDVDPEVMRLLDQRRADANKRRWDRMQLLEEDLSTGALILKRRRME